MHERQMPFLDLSGLPCAGVKSNCLIPETSLFVEGRASPRAAFVSAVAPSAMDISPNQMNKLGHGTFVPDDLLKKCRDGYRIVGRVSDLINVAGKKVIRRKWKPKSCAAKACAKRLFLRAIQSAETGIVACVVAAGAVNEDELLAHCRARFSSWQTPRRIFLVERMPVNERGKISRRELARIYSTENSDAYESLLLFCAEPQFSYAVAPEKERRVLAPRRSHRLGRHAS